MDENANRLLHMGHELAIISIRQINTSLSHMSNALHRTFIRTAACIIALVCTQIAEAASKAIIGTLQQVYTLSSQTNEITFLILTDGTSSNIELTYPTYRETVLITANKQPQMMRIYPGHAVDGPYNRTEAHLYLGDRPVNEPAHELLWLALNPDLLSRFRVGGTYFPGLLSYEACRVTTNADISIGGERFHALTTQALKVGSAKLRNFADIFVSNSDANSGDGNVLWAYFQTGTMTSDGVKSPLSITKAFLLSSYPTNSTVLETFLVEGRGIIEDYRFVSTMYPKPLRYEVQNGKALPATNDPLVLLELRSMYATGKQSGPISFWLLFGIIGVVAVIAVAIGKHKKHKNA